MSPGVDYIINEIVSKSIWVSGNAITFLFNYYVLPKKFLNGYAINPYMTFDAYLTSKAKGAELVVEYENKSTATINGNLRYENTIAFVRKDLNTLFVKIETPFRAEVKLVNSLGQTLKSKMSSGNEEYIQFDISGLRSGMYLVGIKIENSLSYHKILL
jgi:hypothetical protein